MVTNPIDTFLFLVFFIYGLAFFGMGMALAIESGRFPALADAKVIRPLAIFGLLHGTHEWLDAYLMQAETYRVVLPTWLPWFRLMLLTTSFVFLIAFVAQTFRSHRINLHWAGYILIGILGIYLLFILVNAGMALLSGKIGWFDLLNVLSRYLLAVPGGILAAYALRLQATSSTGEERRHLITHLTIAAIGFFIYGLAQFFVTQVDMFPARFINTTVFRDWFGFPIQLVRAAMAVLITLGLLRVIQLAERERQRLATAAQKAHLEALEQRDRLRHELLSHTVQAQEEERSRIARELHDETAQVLTALSLDLASLHKELSGKPETIPLVERLQTLSKQMAQGIYRLVHDLRPAQLDDLGLIPAIHYLKDSMSTQGLEVSLSVQGQNRRLNSIVETVLFRVAQEALNNTLRHAHTQKAQIQVEFQDDQILLRLIDSGTGFNPDLPLTPPHGWGLAGMRERVDLVGGQLRIESAAGQGTVVEVKVPTTNNYRYKEEANEKDTVNAGR